MGNEHHSSQSIAWHHLLYADQVQHPLDIVLKWRELERCSLYQSSHSVCECFVSNGSAAHILQRKLYFISVSLA